MPVQSAYSTKFYLLYVHNTSFTDICCSALCDERRVARAAGRLLRVVMASQARGRQARRREGSRQRAAERAAHIGRCLQRLSPDKYIVRAELVTVAA